MAEPRVSAIIPVRDGALYLAQALESVLAQTVACAEVVVVDDGSKDDSAAIAAGFDGVEVISGPAAGIGAARNRGIEASSGEFIALLDADDLWQPGKTEAQLAHFARAPETDLVRSQVEQFLSPEIDPGTAGVAVPEGPGAMMTAGAMIWRRSLVERIGGFSETVDMGEMLDWMLRARRAGIEELVTDDLVLRRRVHRSNTSTERAGELRQYARILKANLDARRGGREPGESG
jgi:glycosyltransferase involved in cell wall biosynthesis